MKTLISLLFAFLFIYLAESKERDVCILGAGASGLSTAVFLKDKGYDVAVVDIKDQVGGNCNTEYFTPSNASDKNWYELGVTAFVNSTFLQERGYGDWGNFSSEHFVKRFIKKPLIPYVLPNNPKLYIADFYTKFTNPSPIDPTPLSGFNEAFARYATQLALYPWINTGDIPDVIPPELLVPFSQFVATHQLEPLVTAYFRQYVYNFRNKNMFESPTYSVLFDAGQWLYEMSSNPLNGFQVNGGCLRLYKNMANYIGQNNVYLSKEILKVEREEGKVKIQFEDKRRGNYYSSEEILECKKVIVSFYPGLENLEAFDLTSKEKKVFQYADSFEIYPFSVNLKNSLDFLLLSNLNLSDTTYQLPSYPFISNLVNFIGANTSPSTGYLLPSQVPQREKTSKQLIRQQLSNMTDLFTLKSVEKVVHHYLSPQFNKKGMEKGVIRKLRGLQGKSNTYWIGATTRIDWAHTLWYQSQKFVDKYF